MWALWTSLALAAPLAASHDGVVSGDTVTWTSEVVLTPSDPGTTPLAVPLPPDTRVDGARVVTGADGSVVALVLAGPRATVRVTDPLADGLNPPVVAGAALQRVVVDHATLRADPSLGVERRVRYAAAPEVGHRERRALDRTLRRRTRARDQALLVTGDQVARAGGLRATVEPRGASLGTVGVALGAFAAAILGMVILYRALARVERREANRAYIEREFDRAG